MPDLFPDLPLYNRPRPITPIEQEKIATQPAPEPGPVVDKAELQPLSSNPDTQLLALAEPLVAADSKFIDYMPYLNVFARAARATMAATAWYTGEKERMLVEHQATGAAKKAAQEGRDPVAAEAEFRGDMVEADAAWMQMRDLLAARGIKVESDFWNLRKDAVALTGALGPYEARHTPKDVDRVRQASWMVAAINAGVADPKLRERYRSVWWDKIKSSFRAAPADMTAEQFEADRPALAALAGALDSPGIGANAWAFSALSPKNREKGDRYLAAMLGGPVPKGMPNEEKVTSLRALLGTADVWDRRLDGYVKWAQLGMAPRLEDMPDDGRLLLGQAPLFGDLWAKDLQAQGAGTGFDRTTTAEHNVRNGLVQQMLKDPAGVVATYFGDAPPPVQQSMLAAISQPGDGPRRVEALRRFMDEYDGAASQRAARYSNRFSGTRPAPADVNLQALFARRTDQLVAEDVGRQARTPAPQMPTPLDVEEARQFWLDQGRQWRERAVMAQAAAESSVLWNKVMLVPGLVAGAMEKTGLNQLLSAAPEQVYAVAAADILSGKQLRGEPTGAPQNWTELFHQQFRAGDKTLEQRLEDFYHRKMAGKTNAADEAALLPYLLTDMAMQTAGFVLDQPGQAALLGYGAGKLLHARSAAGDALVRAGMPAPVVAGLEMASSPANFMAPFRRLGWKTDVITAAGRTLRGFRSGINKLSDESRGRALNYMKSVLDFGRQVYGSPEAKLGAVQSAVARVEAEMKMRGSLSRATAWELGESLRDAPAQLTQDLMAPVTKGQAARNPFSVQAEAKVMLENLRQLENDGAASGAFEALKTSPSALLWEFSKYRAMEKQASFDKFAARWQKWVPKPFIDRLRPIYDTMAKLSDAIPALATEVPAAIEAEHKLSGDYTLLWSNMETTRVRLAMEWIDHRLFVANIKTAAELQQLPQRQARMAFINDATTALHSEIGRLKAQQDVRTTTRPGAASRGDGFKINLAPALQREVLSDLFHFTRQGTWEQAPKGILIRPEQYGDAAASSTNKIVDIEHRTSQVWFKSRDRLIAERARLDEAVQLLAKEGAAAAAKHAGIELPVRERRKAETLERRTETATATEAAAKAGRAAVPPELASAAAKAGLKARAAEAKSEAAMRKAVEQLEVADYVENAYLEKEIGARRERLEAGLDAINERMRAQFIREAQKGGLLDIQPLRENYRQSLAQMREWYTWLEGQAQAPNGIPLGLGTLLSSTFRPLAIRGLSDLDFRIETSRGVLKERLLKFEFQYDRLDPRAREVFNAHQRGEDVALPQELETMSIELTDVRREILTELHRIGKIDDQVFRQLITRPYEERVYLNELEGRRIAGLRAEEPFAMGRGDALATPPRFEHLRPQRSTRYVRQLYWDPAKQTLAEEHFYVKDNGSPAKALAVAEKWRAEQLKSGRLTEAELGQLVPAITDLELGALGLVDDLGLVRFANLQKLLSESAAYETFGIVARMGGLAKRALDGVPNARMREWSKKLEGKDWGPLEGMHIHRNVVHMIRSWSDLHSVLGGFAEAARDTMNELKPWMDNRSFTERVLYGREQPSRVARVLRTSLILGSLKSWFNNTIGGTWSAFISGVNPASASWLHDYLIGFGQMQRDLRDGKIVKGHKHFEDIQMFSALGQLSQTAGLGGSSSTTSASMHLEAENLRLVRRMEKYEQMQQQLLQRIANGEYDKNPALKTTAEATIRDAGLILEDMKKEAGKRSLGMGWVKRELKGVGGLPEYSKIINHLGDWFGSIDARSRWATFLGLRRHGLSRESAIGRIAAFFQNYAQVPDFVRNLRNRLLGGAMVPSFSFEAARTMANAMQAAPGRFLLYVLSRPLWNRGALLASGISMEEYGKSQGHDSKFEMYASLFSNIVIPTPGGMLTLDTSGSDPASVLYRSAGPMGALVKSHVTPSLEKVMGPLAVVPSLILNYASQFVGNTPVSSLAMKTLTGVDVQTGELITSEKGDMSFLTRAIGSAASLMVPRTFMAGFEAATEYGPTSLYTGGVNTFVEKLASKWVAGTRYRTARELVVATIIQRLHEGERSSLYSEYLDEHRELVSLSQKFQAAKTVEEREALKAQGVEIMKTVAKEPLSDKEAAERFITWASHNAYQLIDRMPIDRLPSLVQWLQSSNYGPQAQDLIDYGWLQLLHKPYLSGRNDADQLVTAVVECARLGEASLDPTIKARFVRGTGVLLERLRDVAARQPAPLRERLARTRLGNAPRTVQLELERILSKAR